MAVTVTDKAVKEINRIKEEQNYTDEAYLRVRIVGGGCSGFSTKLDLDENYDEKKGEWKTSKEWMMDVPLKVIK